MAHKPMQQDAQGYQPVFVARQPVFDRQGAVWGYELLFRQQGSASVARVEDQEKATAQVIADGVALARLEPGNRILVNFSRELLLEGVPMALPRDCCVVEILEHVQPEPAVLQALKELKQAGYTLALDDYIGQKELEPFLDLVDLVKVDFLNLTPSAALELATRLEGRTLLAEKIEDERSYQLAWVLGFSYFQGYWFSRPVTFSGRTFSTGAMAKFRLLRELSRDDYEVATLGRIISSDSSLSYRLLKYVNSVSFSLKAKVSSLKQAVTLLGAQSLKQWLMAVVIADVAPGPRALELAYRCVQRGRFLELCAAAGAKTPRDAETMFLLGLFSQLDDLLGQDMSELLEEMPIDEDVKLALMGTDNAMRPWLDVCAAVEAAQWLRLEELALELGLNMARTARLHAKATDWASDIMGLCETMQRKDEDEEQEED